MRVPIAPVSTDVATGQNFSAIREALNGNISYDNMNVRVISGTTSSTVDGQGQFQHSMSPQPIGWLPLAGDVYVQSIDSKFIDVRSTKASVPFNIIVVGGTPITGTTNINVQEPVANPNAGSSFYDTYFMAEAVATGTGTFQYRDIVQDSLYFYVTQGGTGAISNLTRVNKLTGQADFLTLGAAALGPMFFIGTQLYVAQTTAAAGAINIYSVDTTTFTLTSTIGLTGASNFGNASSLYCDGVSWYLAGSNVSVSHATVEKAAFAGGACTILNVESSGGGIQYCCTKLIPRADFLWCIVYHNGGVPGSIISVNWGAYTVNTQYTFPTLMQVQPEYGVEINGVLWMPTQSNTFASSTTSAYACGLSTFDFTTHLFNFLPIPGAPQGGGSSSNFRRNLVWDGGDSLYMMACTASTFRVITYSLSAGTLTHNLYPIGTTGTIGGSIGGGMSACMNLDPLLGTLQIVLPLTAQPNNFEWFYPDLTQNEI